MVLFLFRIFLLSVPMFLIACGDSSDSATESSQTYVGRVFATQLAVAVAETPEQVILYVCDSNNGRRFDFALGEVSYMAPLEGIGSITITRIESGYVGAVSELDVSYPFVLENEGAVLWAESEVEGQSAAAGWVVFSDDSERGGVVRGIRGSESQISDGTSNTLTNTSLSLQASNADFSEHQTLLDALIALREPL